MSIRNIVNETVAKWKNIAANTLNVDGIVLKNNNGVLTEVYNEVERPIGSNPISLFRSTEPINCLSNSSEKLTFKPESEKLLSNLVSYNQNDEVIILKPGTHIFDLSLAYIPPLRGTPKLSVPTVGESLTIASYDVGEGNNAPTVGALTWQSTNFSMPYRPFQIKVNVIDQFDGSVLNSSTHRCNFTFNTYNSNKNTDTINTNLVVEVVEEKECSIRLDMATFTEATPNYFQFNDVTQNLSSLLNITSF